MRHLYGFSLCHFLVVSPCWGGRPNEFSLTPKVAPRPRWALSVVYKKVKVGMASVMGAISSPVQYCQPERPYFGVPSGTGATVIVSAFAGFGVVGAVIVATGVVMVGAGAMLGVFVTVVGAVVGVAAAASVVSGVGDFAGTGDFAAPRSGVGVIMGAGVTEAVAVVAMMLGVRVLVGSGAGVGSVQDNRAIILRICSRG